VRENATKKQALPMMALADNTVAHPAFSSSSSSSSSLSLHDHLLLWQAMQRVPEEKLDLTTSRSGTDDIDGSDVDDLAKFGDAANDGDWRTAADGFDSFKRRQSPNLGSAGGGSAARRSTSNVSADRRSESEESAVGTETEESSTNMMSFLHDVDLGSSDDDGGAGEGGRS
jgi:hypothetical protein